MQIYSEYAGICTFTTLISFSPLISLTVCTWCAWVRLCARGCDVDRGRGALPEKSPDNHGYLCGSVGGGHRVCGCLL